MIHYYFGFGKGKTSSAVGAGMRAAGAGLKVLFVQFLKNNKSSELNVLPFEVFESPKELPFNPDYSYCAWVKNAVDFIKKSDCDMIILDEFADLKEDFISNNDMIELLNLLSDKEVIITGHNEKQFLTAVCDYVTFFEKVKHPYDKGVNARKGIEY